VVDNARALADELSGRGFAPVSGGTDTHLVLVDLRDSHPEVTGQAAEEALEDVGIVCNKNTVPGETRSPFVASGIRVGTPALTTRGFDEDAIRTVGATVADVVDGIDPESGDPDPAVQEAARETVRELCEAHPLYED
jgi:glycine hydroxymethyltransferase